METTLILVILGIVVIAAIIIFVLNRSCNERVQEPVRGNTRTCVVPGGYQVRFTLPRAVPLQGNATFIPGIRHHVPPWVWVVIGALVLIIAAILFFGRDRSGNTAITPTPAVEQIAPTSAAAGTTAPTTVVTLTQHQIDSIMAIQPMNLWNLIDQLDGQKKAWDAQVSTVQGVTSKLYQKAMALTGGLSQNIWGQISQMSQMSTQQQYTPSLVTTTTTPEILNTISTDVKEIKKDLKEHRAGARASHAQAVNQRNQIQDQLDGLDSQITLARGEVAAAKEELKNALKSGSQSQIDNLMENLRLRIEGLERLQKITK